MRDEVTDRDIKRLAKYLLKNIDISLTKLYTKLTRRIMSALEDLKADLQTAVSKVDILVPAVQGVKKDVAFIKRKLDEAGGGGINAAGVAELRAIITPLNEQLATATDELAALDAETDSDEEEEPDENES